MPTTLPQTTDQAETAELMRLAASYREAYLAALAKLNELHTENRRLRERVRELHQERRDRLQVASSKPEGRAA